MDQIQNHYERIGHDFDILFSFEDSYENEQANDIIKWLELRKSCILADIAGGTGKWSSAILQHLDLENNIILQDPSQAMVNVANQKEGVTAFCEDVHEFMKKEGLDFSKCLIRSAIHHFSEIEKFYSSLYRIHSLEKVLILTSPKGMTCYPMFQKAHDTTAELGVHMDQEYLLKAAECAGFKVEKMTKKYTVNFPKEKWLYSVRNRMFSNLEPLTDEEINEGIEEIRQRYPGGTVTFDAVWVAILLTKTLRC